MRTVSKEKKVEKFPLIKFIYIRGSKEMINVAYKKYKLSFLKSIAPCTKMYFVLYE